MQMSPAPSPKPSSTSVRFRAGWLATGVAAASILVTACVAPSEEWDENGDELGIKHQEAGKPGAGFTITPSAAAGGTISPSTPQVVNNRSSVTFTSTATTAAPNCFLVGGFSIDNDGNGTFDTNTAPNLNSYTFTNPTSNKGIRALFSPASAYSVASSVDALGTGNGTIASHPASVCAGQGVSISFTPAVGSVVGDVSVNGVSVGAVNPLVLSNIQLAESVVVRFDAAQAGSITASITPLRNNASGAVSYTFDDALIYPDMVRLKAYMDNTPYVNPDNASDTGSYDLPVSYCVNSDDFVSRFATQAELDGAFANLADWATDTQNQFRVCSHSKSHPHITTSIATAEIGTPVRVLYDGVRASLAPELWDAAKPIGFAYPYNDWGDPGLATEVLKYHAVGRVTDEFEINGTGDFYFAGEPTLLPNGPRYGSVHSCVFGVSRTCKVASYPPGNVPSNNGNGLNYVRAAIENNKWMVYNFHNVQIGGVAAGTYGLLLESQLKAFLDYAQQQKNAGNLFVDGLAEVAQYIKEVQNSSVTAPVVGADTITFSVSHSIPSLPVRDENGNSLYSIVYNYPLTVRLAGADVGWASAVATQGGNSLTVKVVSGALLVDGVVPNGGPVTLTR